jgi:hypothetical protein
MKQFSVHADCVAGYGKQVARAHQDAVNGNEYTAANGEIGAGEQGWLALLGDAHKMIIEAVSAEIDGLAEACASGAAGLSAAAAHYRKTDEHAAAELDATLTGYHDREAYFTSHYDRNGAWEAK